MANLVSKIKLPNNTEYIIKDGTLNVGNSLNINEDSTTGERTIIIDNSINAGDYGPSAAATPSFGANFNVPYIQANAQGLITSINNQTVTIPGIEIVRLVP